MPELPEVQTIVNDLQLLTDDTIVGFWTDFPGGIKTKCLEREVVGKKIRSIARLSKNIVIRLNNDVAIIIHLKMTGKLVLNSHNAIPKAHRQECGEDVPSRHLHHIFHLKKNGSLAFYDLRKFATIEAVTFQQLTEIAKGKGLDPFSKDFTLHNFTKIIAGKKNSSIKSVLMDQKAIAGIGNIYASEIPFQAKLNPLRKVTALKKNEVAALYRSLLLILSKAIELRGTSISDYRDAKGKKGGFQNELKVYGKAGKKCTKCDTIIEKVTVEQRSTFFCPACQK